MISDLLVGLIAVSALYCRGQDRLAVSLFSLGVLSFSWVGGRLDDYDGTVFHALAYAFDLLVIFLLSKIAYPTSIIVNLQTVCRRFIYINVLGWVAYMLYFPPIAYNWACSVLYAWILLTILAGSRTNDKRDNAVGGGLVGVYRGNPSGGFTMQTNKKAAGN